MLARSPRYRPALERKQRPTDVTANDGDKREYVGKRCSHALDETDCLQIARRVRLTQQN